MSSSNPELEIARHYTHGSLLETILGALKAAGLDPARLSADDLSPIDEFHTGGRAATVDLASEMGIEPGMHLLDVGCGIGGPSRYFAAHRGCTVTGVDLSAEFFETAQQLSLRTGLSDRTDYRNASAVSLPFADAEFDGAYMIHVGMNLPKKAAVFQEVSRVLRPGAVFGIFDMMREAEGDLTFPLPWAASREMSFVETQAAYSELLEEAGFDVEKHRTRRDFALAFFAKLRAEAVREGNATPLGLPILMGPAARSMVTNLMEVIHRGVLSPTEIVCRKKS